ncbi:MAG TPA: Spy/CpxP family protein refolding chaperone [Alphaproteobacteria bacterium]|jgi:hypothetical protein|nr:Spy/CpxP family protein refolding chaperone [Alphaproteobacteria bacterium]
MNLRAQLSLSAVVLAGTMAWCIPVTLAQTPQQSTTEAPPTGAKEPHAKGMGMMGKGGGPDMTAADTRQMMSMMHDMVGMMRMQTRMMSSCGEDTVTALKAELKITDVQAPLWSRFADVLENRGKAIRAMHAQMGAHAEATLPERLDHQEKMMSAHLDSLKSLKDALTPLYASLSDEQKKIMDQSMIGPMLTM